MSVQALSWVFDYSPTTGSDRLVLLAIANHADVDGAHSFPGIDTLAREARVSRATAKRAIRGLEDHQHIDVAHGVGRGHPNLYRVITDSDRVGTRRVLPARTTATAETAQAEPNVRGPRKGAQFAPVHKRAQPDPNRDDPETAHPELDSHHERAQLRSQKGSAGTTKGLSCDPLTVTNRQRTENQARATTSPRENQEGNPLPALRLGTSDGDVPIASDDVQSVFDEWVRATNRSDRTRLDDKRRALIRRQLRHYPVDDLMDAVRGWAHSPFHRGNNATGEPVHDLRQLIGDAEHLERFRDLARTASQPGRLGGTNPIGALVPAPDGSDVSYPRPQLLVAEEEEPALDLEAAAAVREIEDGPHATEELARLDDLVRTRLAEAGLGQVVMRSPHALRPLRERAWRRSQTPQEND